MASTTETTQNTQRDEEENNNNNNNNNIRQKGDDEHEEGAAAAGDEGEEQRRKNDSDERSKMPLHRRWVLWYDHRKAGDDPVTDYKETLKKCGTFDTVGDFWSTYNNVLPPSTIPVGANYHLFTEGVWPLWEDPANIEGGKFVMTMPKKESRAGKLDEFWTFTVMAAIGETMDASGNDICGAVVSIRKSQDRIALWLKSCDPNVCFPIGDRWKRALEVTSQKQAFAKFQSHRAAAERGSSYQIETLFEV